MKKEKLEINKNNYEGYIKLYDTYFFDKKDEPRIYKAVLGGVLISAIGFVGVLFSPVPVLFGLVVPLSISMTVGSVRSITGEKQDELKKQYPYLNYKISKQELEESLQEIGIVTKDGHGYPNINTGRVEEILAEKYKYLNEQKGYYPSVEYRSYLPEKRAKQLVKTRKN